MVIPTQSPLAYPETLDRGDHELLQLSTALSTVHEVVAPTVDRETLNMIPIAEDDLSTPTEQKLAGKFAYKPL